MFLEVEEEGDWWWRKRRKDKIAAVVEDPIQPDVLWEQRVEDVEAERRRKAVTSPGFSFSAAGLLFPYHLGVAHFLIENGYIKVFVSFCLCVLILFIFLDDYACSLIISLMVLAFLEYLTSM